MAQSDGTDLFGPGKTWWSLTNYAMAVALSRFPGVARDDIEDAVQEAVIWTMTVWVHSPSSVVLDDADLTFRGACWVTTRKTHQLLSEFLASTGPQQGVLDRTRYDPLVVAAGEVVDALQDDPREWEGWARDFLDGISQSEVARREGVSQPAIHYRRRSGLNRIRPLLEKAGLKGEQSEE